MSLAPAQTAVTSAYKRYVLVLLTIVYTLNFLDRGLMMLLLEPIKEDLQLSDTQLGFLTGIAFGLFYATLGLPIARWADRGNRVTITSLAIGLWGLVVMISFYVVNFAQLVTARTVASIGEAGCMPPTYSLLGDYFCEVAERTRAMSIYLLAAPIATLISFVLGGWLNEQWGWRSAFLVIGIPGLITAVLVKLTIREPRLAMRRGGEPTPLQPSFSEVLHLLWHRKSCRHLSIAIILVFAMGLGLSPWYAAFMIRSHGMATAELGVWLGFIFGLSGMAGILLGGYMAGRRLAAEERTQMRLSALMMVLLVPFFVGFLLLPGRYAAMAVLVPLVIVWNFFLGPSFSLLQRLVPDDMRATCLAVVMLLANLIGMGVGPQIVGVVSDLLQPLLGTESLRYAMLAMSLVGFWAAYHFWCVGRAVREDLLQANTSAQVSREVKARPLHSVIALKAHSVD